MSNKYGKNRKLNINSMTNFSVKKVMSILLSITLLISIIQISIVYNLGATEIIDWRKNDVMDINLNIINNKAGDDDVFFQMDVEDAGLYELSYYLEDGRKTTVTFNNGYETMEIGFKIQEYDAGNPGTPIEKTQALIDLSYLEIDYTQQVPGWQFNGDIEVDAITKTLDFTIERSASARYPGVAFQIDNKKFIAKWDFQSDILYVLFDGYENGHIMPVKFIQPGGDEQIIKVLKGLEDFTVTPTYLVSDGGTPATNVEVAPVTHPNANNDKPGNRPGLKYNFKQPKELDTAIWSYSYDLTDLTDIRAVFELDDIGSAAYLDFNMVLNMEEDALVDDTTLISEIPNENSGPVHYTYNAYEYEIIVVSDKSELANPNTIIEWNELESSRIYNTSIGFQFDVIMPDYEFGTFTPESNFAYTYLEYQLKRSDQQEAYLEIEPYEIGTQDEVEYIVLYSKLIAPDLDPVNDLWLKHYQGESDGYNTINIPVPFRANSYQDAYQIIVNFSNTELKSQVLNYRAIDDLNVPPTTPKIQGIENLYVVPPETEDSENPTKIQFDFIWEAIDNRAVSDLDDIFANIDGDDTNDAIYYEVLVNDIPNISEINPFQVVRVYKVTQDPDGTYRLGMHQAISSIDSPSTTTNFNNGYNNIEELFRMEKIVVYQSDLWSPRIDTVYDEEAAIKYEVIERTVGSHPTTFETDFEFPGVNYIRIRAITEKDGVYGVSNYSIPVSLSLSMLKYDIPIVEGITYEPFYSLIDTDPMGIVLDWPAIDISNYENNMLFPVDKSATGLTYSVYLSEDIEGLLNLEDNNDNYTLLTETGGEVAIDSVNLDILRGENAEGIGNILYFEVNKDTDSTANIMTRIEGLDLNNNYYTRVVVNVNIVDLGGVEETRSGKPSSILSITTPIVPQEPGDDEIIPLAPENLVVDFFDENKLTTTLEWNIPEEISIKEDTFGFEILSIEDLRLPNSLKSKDTDLLDIIADETLENRETEVWRVYYEGADIVLKKYNKETSVWEDQDLDLLQTSDTSIRIIDDNNSPNRVMYYYVRTMNVSSGVEIKASSWVEGTKTTAPVSGPINLIVDYNTTIGYDSKYESIIRFDAPIPSTAIIESDFIMEIFIKGEDDLEYVKATKVLTTTGANDTYYAEYLERSEGPVGYERLNFKISGLKAGKQYYIKVRIEDRTKLQEILPDGSLSYPKSPFSDKITTRTEFSQDDYDKEIKYKQYVDYYLKKAEALKQVPYFTLEQDDDVSTAKYRMDYIDGLLQINKNSNYELVAFDKKTSIYYLPAEMIKIGNDLNISYMFEPSGQLVSLKPYSIGEVITTEVNTVIDKINDYNARLEDYYIQIQLSVGDYNGKINNRLPSSKLVYVEVNVIGSKEFENDIDIYLEDELDKAITRGKTELIVLLEEELDRGINDPTLTKIVQEVLALVGEDFSVRGQAMFDSYLDTIAYPIIELEKPIVIGLSPDDLDSNNTIYGKITGDWKVKSSLYYDNRYHISSYELGSFVAVDSLNGAGLETTYSTEQVTIINKYNLGDVFTTYELRTPSELITNMQMIQTFARLIGANSDIDTKDYLKNEGINVPYLNDFNILNREVSNYLYVQIYTKKQQINLGSVVIRDYNAIEDLSSINLSYRNTLLRGVSLGITELEQNRLLPANQMTIKEFFRLIENIE